MWSPRLRDHGGDLSERRRVERTESETGDGGRRFVVPEPVEKGGEASEGVAKCSIHILAFCDDRQTRWPAYGW